MRLTIAIPEAQLVEAPAALRLIRMAQVSDMEADDQGPSYVACFEDFPQSVNVITRLIWESADPAVYCAQRAARVGDAGACPDRACPSHCQFMCSRCVGVSREQGAPVMLLQLQRIARQAEVDWCPNLRIAQSDV